MGNAIKQAKELKNGKMSVKLDTEILKVIVHAIECAQVFDKEELENYFYFLLEEAKERLQACIAIGGGKVALRKSELFAMISYEVMKYLDDPTKVLLWDLVTPAKRLS